MSTLELERAAQEHYADQRSLVQRIASLITQLGRMLSWDEVRAWFAGPSEVLYDAMVEAQAEAAAQGAAYVGTALAAAGVTSEAIAAVVPESFAGTASDGRDLRSLLAWPIRRGERLVGQGARPEEVTPRVVAELVMIGRTQVADAGRIATGVAQVADRAVVGYVRMVELPACDRCIALAGNLYSWSEGFARHPNCNCVHVPVSSLDEAGDLGRQHHAAALFEQLSRTEQDRIFGRSSARAIRDGSDLHQVVNARRGLYTTADGHRATREGTTVRGFAGRRLGQMERQRGRRYRASRTVRLTPEQIYAEAGDDRDEAIRLLHRFGYLTDLSSAPTRRERPAPAEAPRSEPVPVAAPAPQPEPVREPEPEPEPTPLRPPLGDLIPTEAPTDEQRQQFVEQYREQLNGTYANLRVEVDDVEFARNEATVKARITGQDGKVVGESERIFERDGDTLVAHHESITLDASVQGQGFADAWNGHLIDWYRASGVERIELLANIDVGGYAWASKGYDWGHSAAANAIIRTLRADAEAWGDPDILAAVVDIIDRAARHDLADAQFPSPREISQLGRRPGQGKADVWFGKKAMLGSWWRAVRWL